MKQKLQQLMQWSGQRVNWQLLLFLALVLDVKLMVKVAAILLFALLNLRMLRAKKIYRQQFTWFYYSMIIITLVNLVLTADLWSVNYFALVFTGISFWLLCMAAAFINSWFVQQTDIAKLHNTIALFFIINSLVTLLQLGWIIWDCGSLNPFTFQGMHQKYFISTGDQLTGLSFDVCTTNAVLNAFGLMYFLHRNKMHFVLLCMITLLLTASNFTYILVIIILLVLFIFQSTRNQKSIIIVCMVLTLIFLAKVSPQNNQYLAETYKKLADKKGRITLKSNKLPLLESHDSLLTPEEQKQKIALLYLDSVKKARIYINATRYFSTKNPSIFAATLLVKPTIPKADIHSEPYQRKKDTTLIQKELLDFAGKTLTVFDSNLQATKARKLPGKFIALEQTLGFLKEHPGKIMTGTGIGNFSSKLAFRGTGLRVAGGYPKEFIYMNEVFINNHLALYLEYFSKDAEMHSFINNPNSVYDQLLAEYGIIGFFSFIVLYIGFFIKRSSGYGLPLLLILLGVLWTEYWFEQLSVILLFELLMLINYKEKSIQNE